MLHKYSNVSLEDEAVAKGIVDSCIHFHKNLGPGFPEKIYEAALAYELTKRNISFEKQKIIRVVYPPNIILDPEYR